MIDFFKDFIKFISFKFRKSKNELCFFCENRFILNYLEPFISKKSKNKPVLIFCFENIDYKEFKNVNFFFLKTNFFRELFFLTANFKYLYSSTPDLENTIFKRTKFSKCKYIYLSHTPVSLTLIYSESAFDYFDAVQVTSKFQYNELLEIIKNRNLKTKVLKYPYLFVNNQIKKLNSKRKEKDVLVAPSWNTGFYDLNCHKILKQFLDKSNLTYNFRPHPMSIKKKEISFQELKSLNYSIDDSSFLEFSKYNFFISDWSGIFIEYALIFKRKAHLINTKTKIVNAKYQNYKNKPLEILLRNVLAKTFDLNNINDLVDDIKTENQRKKVNNDFKNDEEVVNIIKKNFY